MSRHACRHALCLRSPTANGFGTFCWGDLQKELVSSNSHAPAEFWSHRLRRRQAPQCSTKDGGRARRGTSHIDPAWCPKLDRLFYPIHSPKCDCGAAACDRSCIFFALGAGVRHWRCLWVGNEPTRCHQNAAHARRWQRRHSRRCGAISAPHPYWWCGARNSVSLCLCVSVSLCLRVSVPLWVHPVSWALLRSCSFAAGVVPRSYCPVSQVLVNLHTVKSRAIYGCLRSRIVVTWKLTPDSVSVSLSLCLSVSVSLARRVVWLITFTTIYLQLYEVISRSTRTVEEPPPELEPIELDPIELDPQPETKRS